jgi:4-amino-4-deoxy-L-arabinose transferase-like glycosyltransferase
VKSNSLVNARQRLWARLPFCSSAGRRLLLAAAVLHVTLALGLFCAGRMQIAPGFIDRDGIVPSFAFDTYEYQRDAKQLSEVLRRDGVAAWANIPEFLHVKLVSILFTLFGPLIGYGPLTAEPFNLFCYLSVIALTFALGKEIGNARIGQIAAVVVALWPTLLLHSLQLLKDTLFISLALALVLCVTTWLTRTYSPKRAIITGAITLFAISLLLFVRSSFAIVILGVVLFGFVLLVVRQLIERRPLYWNMAGPVFILVAGALLIASQTMGASQKFKNHPANEAGEAKAEAGRGIKVRSAASYLPRTNQDGPPTTYTGKLSDRSHRMALRIGSVRDRFSANYAKSGSAIDTGVRIRDLNGLLSYLPRAFVVGCCAPFPTTWLAKGQRVGSSGRLLSGVETLVMYVIGLLALFAIVRPPHRLAATLLLSISILGVTLIGLVVPNVGALYRFRYVFWVLLIILGVKGFEVIRGSVRQWLYSRRTQKFSSAGVTVVQEN